MCSLTDVPWLLQKEESCGSSGEVPGRRACTCRSSAAAHEPSGQPQGAGGDDQEGCAVPARYWQHRACAWPLWIDSQVSHEHAAWSPVQEAQKQVRDARRDASSNEARLKQQERQLMKLKGALAFREQKLKELRQQNEVFKKLQEEELWANSTSLSYVSCRGRSACKHNSAWLIPNSCCIRSCEQGQGAGTGPARPHRLGQQHNPRRRWQIS